MTLEQTIEDVVTRARMALDAGITQRQHDLALHLIAMGLDPTEAEVDAPPDPEAAWRRLTFTEALAWQRAHDEAWRDATLAAFRVQLTTIAIEGA